MINIEIDDTDVLVALQQLATRVDGFRPALRDIGEQTASEIDLRFRAVGLKHTD